MIRYVLYPGWVWSKNDGDRHFIGAAKLAALYDVPMSECVVYRDQPGWKPRPDLIALSVRHDGNYKLEHKK